MFDADLNDIFIAVAISNTCRYRRRYTLHHQFAEMVRQSGIDMVTAEVALGNRPFEVTKKDNPHDLQIRTVEEFWHKENALDLAISHGRRLWPHKKTVAWIDADCAPVGRSFRDAVADTWHELQHYEFVQMWEWLQPLDYYNAPVGSPNPSFVANYIKHGNPYPHKNKHPGYPSQWGSPGLAWAANLTALDHIGGIPDVAILGSGDLYLAHILVSDEPIPEMMSTGYAAGYRNYWSQRQKLCTRWIKGDVGFARGLWVHYWHGKSVNRGYNTRGRILVRNAFDPNTDLKRDHRGLWQLETWDPRQRRLRDQIRSYFRARNEDGIDL